VTRPRAWALAAALLAFVAPATFPTPRALAEDPAPADPIQEAMKLAEEAKPFEQTAGDGDADPAERRTARKTAYEKLKKAVALFDAWLDKHPEDEERLDEFCSPIRTRYFWIKKMMPVEEMGGERPPTPASGPAPPAAGPTGPGAKPPAEPPKPLTPAEVLDAVDDWAEKHKGDVPGQYERYQDFLAKYPDPASPEYAHAMARVEELGKKMKDVYRLIHDDDPDSIKNVDSAQTEKLLGQLVDDLEKGTSPEVRERAARFLGALGSGKAADPLLRVLKKEPSGSVFDACADALARIGGKRVCERLVKVPGDQTFALAVVGILEKILARGGAEGRVAGDALGGYVEAIAPESRPPIFEALAEAGPVGALGLAHALEFSPPDKTVDLIDKLPASREPRVVIYLAKYLVVNAPGVRSDYAGASREAIRKIGKKGVRYLIPNLDDPTVAVWTAKLLQEITGQKLKDDKRKTWQAWFQQNRKALEGK
jgi:hypothetical protein